MYIDIEIEPEIQQAVEEYLAGGGEFATYPELEKVQEAVAKVVREQSEQNFWKADRNHSHAEFGEAIARQATYIKELEARISVLESMLGLSRRVEENKGKIGSKA